MLHMLELKNFKGFEHLGPLALRPLTILCGPNAVGKSTVIQSILMLKQTAVAGNRAGAGTLVTDGDLVQLGDFVDVVFAHDLSRTLTLSFASGSDWADEEVINVLFEVSVPPWEDFAHRWGGFGLAPLAEPSFITRVEIACADRATGHRFVAELSVEDYQDPEGFTVVWSHQTPEGRVSEHFEAGLHFDGFRLRYVELDDDDGELLDIDTKDWRPLSLDDFSPSLGAEGVLNLVDSLVETSLLSLKSVDYLGPQRETPRRAYERRARPEPGGRWRKVMAESRMCSAILPPGCRAEADDDTVAGEYARTEGALLAWLDYLGLPKVHPSIDSNSYRLLVDSPYAPDCRVSVVDTGYGVSQVLPILVTGLTRSDSTLILDQPELHLHPRMQAGMADFAIGVSKSESNQVIVETHSDHFVTRVVRRLVEGEIDPKHVAIYFFTPTADGPHVEEVELDPVFGIKNWPLGFFDEYADEQEAIIRAGLKRRAEEGVN